MEHFYLFHILSLLSTLDSVLHGVTVSGHIEIDFNLAHHELQLVAQMQRKHKEHYNKIYPLIYSNKENKLDNMPLF